MAGGLTYAEPAIPDVLPSDEPGPSPFGHDFPAPTEEDIPTEVAARPAVLSNPSTDAGAEDRKPPASDLLERPATPPTADDRWLPGLVMVGIVGLIVILIASISLLTR